MPHDTADSGAYTQGAQPPNYSKAKVLLSISYALAAWAWRSWEFTVALVLIELYPGSLAVVSGYGLLDNLVRVLGGAFVGRYIDRTERYAGARTLYTAQNVCIGASAVASILLLLPETAPDFQSVGYWALICVASVTGALSSIGSTGVSIAVEKRATKVLCGEDTHALSRMNSSNRAIDLACLLMAPMLSGVLMTYIGPLTAVLVMACYCAVAWIPELLLLRAAFKSAPVLSSFGASAAAAATADVDPQAIAGPYAPLESGGSVTTANEERQFLLAADMRDAEGASPEAAAAEQRTYSRASSTVLSLRTDSMQRRQPPGHMRVLDQLRDYASGWHVYGRQTVLLPNLALAMLYMTVLSLGFLMTSYLRWSGLTEAEVAGYRGIGALTGLLATVLFPFLHNKIGLVPSAVLGIMYQASCLCFGVVPIVVNAIEAGAVGHRPTIVEVHLMVAGLVASRSGLWLFDLAVTQLNQEEVPQDELGTVSGVQSSLQSAFEMMSFIAGLASPNPSQFFWLMLASACNVGAAAMLAVLFGLRRWAASCEPGKLTKMLSIVRFLN